MLDRKADIAQFRENGPTRYEAAGMLVFGKDARIDERSIFRIFSQTKPV